MRSIKLNKILVMVTIVAVVGFGAYAFAGWGFQN
jgi:hypothetical protein